MRVQALLGAAALVGTTLGLSDSTPWVLLSTSQYETSRFDGPAPKQVQSSADTFRATKDFLSRCPTDNYLIAVQPGMNAGDLRQQDGLVMPTFYNTAAKDDRVKGKYVVSEVVGQIPNEDLAGFIRMSCQKHNKQVNVEQVDLDHVQSSDRASSLSENDKLLSKPLKKATSSNSFSVLLYAPPGEPTYEASFDDSLHFDLRRDTSGTEKKPEKGKSRDNRPLFEKYQFFTPAIFSGLLATIVLFSIGSIGIRALSSLEVSYGAFEKEMAPAAQKKQ